MTVDHKFSNTEANSILQLLQGNVQFKVPRFQRNYSWNIEKAEALWDDIIDNFKVIKDNPDSIQEAQYLLGPIVLVRNPNKPGSYFVIDGQQRLSTLTMLFCVARDVILEDIQKEDSRPPEGFGKISELIENTQMEKRTGWKLELNDTDKDFFREIQEYEDHEESQLARIKKKRVKQQSLKFLQSNYIFLHNKITDLLYTDFGDDNTDLEGKSEDDLRNMRIKKHSTLLWFLTHVRENNFLIKIMVSDDSSAFQIFETLNERGQSLSKSNLIKNHILNKVENDEKQRELSDKWNRIFDEIVGNDQPDDDFIMESYHSRNADSKSLRMQHSSTRNMSRRNLYKIIKGMVSNEDDCKRFIGELKKDADFLSQLNDPTTYFDEESKEDILAIKALKAKFIRAPLLAAYRKWYDGESKKSKDYTNLVKFLVKFFFKTRVVRQAHPGDIEEKMVEVTKMINKGDSIKSITAKLKEADDHDDFMYNFKRFMREQRTNPVSKYILQKITLELGTNYDDVRPIDKLTLEHILPQKHDKWNSLDFFKEYKEDGNKLGDFVIHLGNMTLLKQAVNVALQNELFQNKKHHLDKDGNQMGYLNSNLHINQKTVCNYDEWTANIIVQRAEKFAALADQIWRLD